METMNRQTELAKRLGDYSLLDALTDRRSQRFGLGMSMDVGPLAFTSRQEPLPLTEEEEATLAFAACGITGYALADLIYDQEQPGGTIIGGFVGRTIASGDAIQSVALAITNDDATYLLERPQDFPTTELPELIALARQGDLMELYRRSRIKIKDGRAAPPLPPPINLGCNQWQVYAPGTTYFLPINDYTYIYINGLLEFLSEHMAVYLVDERANFRPAGLGHFAKRRGGHLDDDPKAGRTLTIERLEGILQMVVNIEAGMMLQNLGLVAHAIGLGGFPNWAGNEFSWFEALGFRMQSMTGLRFLGASRLIRFVAGLQGKDESVAFPVGLEHQGNVLMEPYCPPYYPSMEAAVRAVVERKFGQQGIFRGSIGQSSFARPEEVAEAAPAISENAIQATIDYCTYIYETYGRFPAYSAPYRTSIGFQAAHLDLEFYDQFYRPEALSERQREHMSRWHQD